jgi:hypothetical protein
MDLGKAHTLFSSNFYWGWHVLLLLVFLLKNILLRRISSQFPFARCHARGGTIAACGAYGVFRFIVSEKVQRFFQKLPAKRRP